MPERTVDTWVAAAICSVFPGARIWDPTQAMKGRNWDRAFVPLEAGMVFIFEDKGTTAVTRMRKRPLAAYGLKFPEAAAKITGDLGELPACCGYPAGHRARLRAASPVEPAVAAVRHRAKVTQGPGSGAAGLAMAFKGIQAARDHWRMASTAHLAALVRAGARSGRGVLTGRPEPAAA